VIRLKGYEAISKRIMELCSKYDLTINGLAERCLLTQSTVENLVNGTSKNPKTLTLIRICAGLNITLKEFFNSDLFDNLDTEL